MTIASSFLKLIIPLVIRRLLFFCCRRSFSFWRIITLVSTISFRFNPVSFAIHPSTELMVSFCLDEGGSSPSSSLTNSATVQDWTHHTHKKKKKKIPFDLHILSGRHHSVGFPSLFVIDRSRIFQIVNIKNPGYSSGIHGVTCMQIRKYNPIWFYIANALRNWMKLFDTFKNSEELWMVYNRWCQKRSGENVL